MSNYQKDMETFLFNFFCVVLLLLLLLLQMSLRKFVDLYTLLQHTTTICNGGVWVGNSRFLPTHIKFPLIKLHKLYAAATPSPSDVFFGEIIFHYFFILCTFIFSVVALLTFFTKMRKFKFNMQISSTWIRGNKIKRNLNEIVHVDSNSSHKILF